MCKNMIAGAMRFAGLVCFSSAVCLAESWSGALVDSRCWNSEEANTRATSVYVDRDGNQELRSCYPQAKTKSFAVVLTDGLNLKLDAEGNARAAKLVQGTPRQTTLMVVITGEANKNTINVDSISRAR